VAAGTIAAKNYLPMARVVADSFTRSHPDVPFFVLLTDEVDGYFEPQREPFHLLTLADVGMADRASARFACSRQELAVRAKPHLLRHLLDEGFQRAVFLDPDILVLGRLSSLFDALLQHPVVLTPHFVSPPADLDLERELNVLQAGVFNGGCVGVSADSVARRFLTWWLARIVEYGTHDVEQGVYYDQRWLDLAFTLFDGVHAHRDATYDVAYWNLPEREVRVEGDRVLVNDHPCAFFHFSGYDPDQPTQTTRHSARLPVSATGPAAPLFERYGQLLEAAGHSEAKSWPYAYGHFDNGVPIPDIARRIYRELDPHHPFDDPARTGPNSFYAWLNESVDDEPDPTRRITHLWNAIHQTRPDLQQAFPNPLGDHRDAYLTWTRTHGTHEHHISDEFLPRRPR
jgi:hypothetical protein